MTNTKSTKRALLTSVMALFLCFAMLLGTTYAWFTDTVTSANNVIQSGNLDIELDYWNGTAWDTVEGADDIINGDLWEPGYTKVAYLRLRNAGSLALKYQLGVNILSEKEGINQAGDTFRLSNYIMFGVVEDVNGETNAYTKDDAGRTKAIADVTDAKKIYEGYTKADSLAANSGYVYLAMVVYMPTDVGNVANHNGTDIPQIDLGINVFATQMTAEEDSFDNQYDANAAFSVWNGVVPTEMPDSLVVDGATQTVHVKDAAAFAYLSTLSAKWAELYSDGNGTTYTNYVNGAGGNYYYSGQWKVSLEADIDLNNHALAPVDIVFGQSTGATAFNGNGHTIRNISAGLFADGTRASFSDLTLENVKATNGALASIVNHSVTDVTVKNATISGVDYVGGLVGKTYSSVIRCKVIDSSVVATGKEAGGLIGYAEANSKGSTITNNVVNNVSVYAGNRSAGLVAQPNKTVKVYNNTVDTVTVGAADTSEYQPGAVVSNALAPENVYDNTVKNATIATNAVAATDNNTLNDAINGDADTVFLTSGEYKLPTMSAKEGITIVGANDGSTVVGGENTSTGFGSNFGKNTTIKNITFSGASNGVRYSYATGGDTTFDNCTFEGGSTYGFHIDESKGATFTFNNCTFVGFNAFAGDLEKVIFNNCTFLHNGNYGHTNIWSTAEFNNCTFGDNASVGTRGDSAHIFFDGVEESYYHKYIGTVESLFAFAESVNEGGDSWNGQKVCLANDIDLENALWTPIGQTGATTFAGSFDGRGYTIKNLKVDSSAQTGGHYSSGLFGWIEIHGSKYTVIENLNVDGVTVTGNHNCGTIVGYATGSVEIKNCNVTNANINCNVANADANGDKAGVIAGNITAEPETKVTNCTASESTVTAGRDAGQLVGAGNTENVTGTATNVSVTANGQGTGANINNTLVGRNL